jgi:hypothetical protein
VIAPVRQYDYRLLRLLGLLLVKLFAASDV